MSVLDLRDAYHTLPLAEESQKYCGLTPYFGSLTYVYLRIGMGMSNLFKVLIRFGFKISLHKCQLFRDKLVYMGLEFLIKDWDSSLHCYVR